MYEHPESFERLMEIDEDFLRKLDQCQVGFEIAKRRISRIKGPTATHLASGRCLTIIDDLSRTGTAIVGTSVLEDLAEVITACRGKLTVLGNLNGVEMRRWTPEQTEAAVKDASVQKGRTRC
jgi:uroporphyrinogen decarboxylase